MNIDASDQPRAKRRGRTLEAEMKRSEGHVFRGRIFNVSADGCKIEFLERPEVGELILVKFEDIPALEATVGWIAEHMCGAKFSRPLDKAALQRLAGALKDE